MSEANAESHSFSPDLYGDGTNPNPLIHEALALTYMPRPGMEFSAPEMVALGAVNLVVAYALRSEPFLAVVPTVVGLAALVMGAHQLAERK